MKILALLTRAAAVALAVCLWAAPLARAHGGPPRLELNVEQINPGGALEVRGINLAPGQPVAVALLGAEVETSLGTAISNDEGDFTQVFTLPVEIAGGAYRVRATDANGLTVEAALTVAGVAAPAEGEGEQRAEEESLLAPMPTRPAVVATSQGRSAPQPASVARPGSWWPVALGAVALAGLGLAVAIRRRATIR